QLVEAVVLSSASGKEGKKPTVKLSIRPSVVDPSKNVAESVVDPRISSVADIHAGQVVHGFVEKTTNVGCFVLLGPRFSARALISELTDEYVRDVAAAFPAGKFVTAIVMSTNPERNQVAISLKPSRIGNVTDAAGNVKRRLDQISVGETLKGTVSRIEEYGVFIKADDAFVNGLCYVREIADSDVPVDPKALYEIGDRVLAKVLKVDIKANRLALGLKTSYFAKDGEEKSGDEDSEASSDEDEEAADNNEGAMSVDDEAESSDDEASGSDSDGMDVDDAAVSSLPVANGFKWDDAEDDSDGSAEQERDSAADSDDESDGETAQSTKKNKSLKRSKLSHIAQDITADLSEQAPKRAVDFERLIVGSPNSSFLWLQFMAFYLGQSEVDQARDVAERALKTIFMSEVQEKMNIW
ncbi:rRNA biogenesis protein rrp5, partial [Coemansia sp. RSA 1285]